MVNLKSKPLEKNPDSSYLNLLDKVDFSPIFILGLHRSGTTILYQLLVATGCFNFLNAYHIIKYNEILANYLEGKSDRAFQDLEKLFVSLGIYDRLIDRVKVTPNLPEEYGFILSNFGYEMYANPENTPLLIQACRKVQFISQRDRPILLKNPWCFPHFMYLKSIFPHAKFIFIHRHPLHVINSKLKAMRVACSQESPYTELLFQWYCQLCHHPLQFFYFRLLYSSFLDLGLKRITQQSVQAIDYCLENIKLLSPDDYIAIRYEDLCQTPEATILKILQFLQLETHTRINYDSQISPRPINLLPEVQKKAPKIARKFQPYLRHCGY